MNGLYVGPSKVNKDNTYQSLVIVLRRQCDLYECWKVKEPILCRTARTVTLHKKAEYFMSQNSHVLFLFLPVHCCPQASLNKLCFRYFISHF